MLAPKHFFLKNSAVKEMPQAFSILYKYPIKHIKVVYLPCIYFHLWSDNKNNLVESIRMPILYSHVYPGPWF